MTVPQIVTRMGESVLSEYCLWRRPFFILLTWQAGRKQVFGIQFSHIPPLCASKKKKAPFVGWNLRSSWKTEVAHTQTWNGCISSPWQADSHCNWQQILHPAHGSAQVHIKSFLRGKLKVSLSNGPCRSSCHCRLAGEPGLLSDHQALWSMLRSTNTIWWADNLSRKAPSESLALLMHSYACLHSLLVSLAYGLTSCAGFDPKISVTNVGWPQW